MACNIWGIRIKDDQNDRIAKFIAGTFISRNDRLAVAKAYNDGRIYKYAYRKHIVSTKEEFDKMNGNSFKKLLRDYANENIPSILRSAALTQNDTRGGWTSSIAKEHAVRYTDDILKTIYFNNLVTNQDVTKSKLLNSVRNTIIKKYLRRVSIWFNNENANGRFTEEYKKYKELWDEYRKNKNSKNLGDLFTYIQNTIKNSGTEYITMINYSELAQHVFSVGVAKEWFATCLQHPSIKELARKFETTKLEKLDAGDIASNDEQDSSVDGTDEDTHDRDEMAASWDNSILGDYAKNYNGRLKLYLSTLAQRTAPIIGNSDANYLTDDELGVVQYMDVNYVQTQIQALGPFAGVEDFINKLEKKALSISSLYGVGKLVNDMRKDAVFANFVYTQFAKPILNAVSVQVTSDNANVALSNDEAFAATKVIYTLQADANQIGRGEFRDDDIASLNKALENVQKLNNSTLLQYDGEIRNKVKDTVVDYISRHFPSLNRENIINWFFDNPNTANVAQLRNLVEALINYNSGLKKALNNENEYRAKYYKARREYNEYIKGKSENEIFRDRPEWNEESINKKARNSAINALSKILLEASDASIRLNSFNAEGKMRSNVGKSSYITDFAKQLKLQFENGKDGREVIKDFFTKKKYDITDVETNMFLFGLKDRNGNIIQHGLIRKDKAGNYVIDEDSSLYKQFDIALFDGIKNTQSKDGVVYSNMSKEDYLLSSLLTFDAKIRFDGLDDSAIVNSGNYLMRIPSDASNTYMIQMPRIPLNDLYSYENEELVRDRQNEIKNRVQEYFPNHLDQSENVPESILPYWRNVVNSTTNDNNSFNKENSLNNHKDILLNLFITGKIDKLNFSNLNKRFDSKTKQVYIPLTYFDESSKFMILVKGDTNENNNVATNLEIVAIRSIDKYIPDEDNGLGQSFTLSLLSDDTSYTQTKSVRNQVFSFIDNSSIAIRDYLYERGEIKRSFNKNSKIFLSYRNELWGELQQFATNLNNVFEKDDEGIWRVKENLDGLFDNFHYKDGKIIDNGTLAGDVFKFFKLFDVGTNVNSRMQSLLGNLILEDRNGAYLNPELIGNLIYETYANGQQVLTVGDDFQSGMDESISNEIDSIVEDWLDSYVTYCRNSAEEFDTILNSEFNHVDIVDWGLNTALAYMTMDGIFEGSSKYYKDAKTFLKRAKETQMGGTPYVGADFTQYEDKIVDIVDDAGKPQEIKIGNLTLTPQTGFRAVTIKNSKTKYTDAQYIYDETFKSISKTISDEELASKLARDIALPFGDIKIGNTVFKGKSTKANDAQSYITIEEFIRRRWADGTLNEYKPLLEQLLDPNIPADKIDLSKVSTRIQAQKNVYYDLKYDEDTGQHRPRQIKNAEFVLIPKLLDKDSSLYQLYDIMKRNNIGQVNTLETSKASNKNVLTFWDDKGKANPLAFESSLTGKRIVNGKLVGRSTYTNVEDFYYKNLYKQLDVVDHIEDKENKAGIQLFKKIQDNATDETRPFVNNIQNGFAANIRDSYNKLIDRLGWKVQNGQLVNKDGSTTLNYNEIYNLWREELSRSGIDENMEDYLTPGIDGLPIMPEWMSIFSTKLENIAQSVFNSNITRQTLPGYHGIQVTNIGWSTELHYHPVEGDRHLPVVEIMVPAYSKSIKQLIAKYGKEEALKKLQEKGLDEHIGYRIPTEGKQSIAIFKIKGFLDETYGSSIIVANEWVTQTGSDFDIDSIYALVNEIDFDGTNINKVEYNIDDNIHAEKQRYIDNVKELLSSRKEDLTKYNTFEDYVNAGKRFGFTYDNFKKLTPIEQLTRRQRNNFITDNVMNIMSNPSSFEETFGRSNFESITDAKNEVEAITNRSLNNASVYNPFDQIRFMQNAIDGRKLKAFSVNRDTFTSICNKLQVSLSERNGIRVIYNNKNEDLIKSAYDIERSDDGKIVVNHTNFGWSKNNRNVDGRLITSYSSQTTAHILDAIKEGSLFNETEYTFGTFKTLIDLGIDYKTAITWLYQPAITRINDINSSSNSIYLNGKTKNKFDASLVAQKRIAQELGLIENDYTSIKDLYAKLEKDTDYIEILTEVFDGKGGKLAINPEAIERRLKGQDVNGKTVTAEQLERRNLIFDLISARQFYTFKSLADKVENISRVLRPDAFGAKQIIRDNKNIISKVEQYRDKLGYILTTPDGRNIINAIYSDNSEYKYLNAFYNYSTKLSVEINTNLFRTEQVDFQNIIEDIETKIGSDLNDENYLAAKKYVIGSLYRSVPALINPVTINNSGFVVIDKDAVTSPFYWENEIGRIYGFIETEVNNPDIDINDFSKENLDKFNKLTPAQKILFIKSHFEDGSFFDKISVVKSFKNEITNKKYSYNRIFLNDMSYDINALRNEFKQIFFNKNPYIKSAAVDLVKYAFIVEGYDFRKQTISKAIPNEVIYAKINEGGLNILDFVKEEFNTLEIPSYGKNGITDNFIRSHSDILNPIKIWKSNKFRQNPVHDDLVNHYYDKTNHMITIPKNNAATNVLNALKLNDRENNYIKLTFSPNGKEVTYLYRIFNPRSSDNIYLVPINTLEEFENSDFSINNANNEHNSYEYYLNIIRKELLDKDSFDLSEEEQKDIQEDANLFEVDETKILDEIPKYKFVNQFDENKLINKSRTGTETEIAVLNKFFNDIEENVSELPDNISKRIIKNSSPLLNQLLELNQSTSTSRFKVPFQDTYITIEIKRENPINYANYQEGNIKKLKVTEDIKYYSEKLGKINKFDNLFSFSIVSEKTVDGSLIEYDNRDSRYDDIDDVFAEETVVGSRNSSDNIAALIAKDLKFNARLGQEDAIDAIADISLNGTNIHLQSSLDENFKSVYNIANKYYKKVSNDLLTEFSSFTLENGNTYAIDNSKLYQEATAKDFANLLNLLLRAKHFIESIEEFDILNITGEDEDTRKEIELLKSLRNNILNDRRLKIAFNKTFNIYLAKESGNPLTKVAYKDAYGNEHRMINITDVFGDTSFVRAQIADIAHIPNKQIQIVAKIISEELNASEYRGRDKVANYDKWISDNIGSNPNEVFNKIVDENGKLIQPFTDAYIDDFNRQRIELQQIEDTEGRFSANYFLKKLEFDKWKLRNSQQRILDDYYDRHIRIRETGYRECGEDLLEYLKLQHRLYTEFDDDMLSESEVAEKVAIIERLRELREDDGIKNYASSIKALNEEYFEFEESEEFKVKLAKYQKIVEDYNKAHKYEPLSSKLENADYNVAYNWIKENTFYTLNAEAYNALSNAYGILKLGNFERRTNPLVKKIYDTHKANNTLYDIYRRVIGTNFTDAEIKEIRDFEASRYSPVEGNSMNPHSDSSLIKNVPQQRVLSNEFWINQYVSQEEKTPEVIEEKKKAYTTINTIIAKGINKDTGLIEVRRLFDNCTQDELDELIDAYRTLKLLSNNRTRKKTKKGKNIFEFKYNEADFAKQYAIYNSLNRNEKYLFEQIFCETDIHGEVQETEEGLLKPNGFIYGYVELTDEAIAEHPEYIDERKEKAIKLLNENEEFVPTEYYYQKVDEVTKEAQRLYDEAIASGKSTKEAEIIKNNYFQTWYNNNHIWNKYTNKYQPISIWTTRHIKEDGSLSGQYSFVPVGDNIDRKIKEDKLNTNFSKSGNNYKLTGDYNNPKYSSILGNTESKEYKLYTYLENLFNEIVTNSTEQRFINEGWMPRQYKLDPDASWYGKQVLGAFGFNFRNYKNKRWDELVDYYHQPSMHNPMLELLKAKGYEQMEEIPEKSFGQSDEDYNNIVNEIRQRNAEREKKNLELERNVRDSNWNDVIRQFIYTQEQYNAKSNLKNLAYLTIDDLVERKAYKINNWDRISKDRRGTENVNFLTEEQKNTLGIFSNWVRRVLYGQYKRIGPLNKVADTLQNMASAKYMMFNLYAGINNVTVGAVNILGERFAREYFGNKEWLAANKEYVSNMLTFIKDTFSENGSNRTSSILKRFDAVEIDRMLDFTGGDFSLSKISEHFNTIAYSLQSGGEHYMQNTALIAMLKSHRVVTDPHTGKKTIMSFGEYTSNLEIAALKRVISNNEYLTAKLNEQIRKANQDKQLEYEYDKLKRNVVTDFFLSLEENEEKKRIRKEYLALRKEMNIDDKAAFEANPDVWSQFDNNGRFKEDSGLDDSHFGMLKNRIIRINHKIHGVYDKNGAAQIEKHWWGSLAMQFKKHIYPGLLKRWATRGYYNESRGTFEKGSYISVIDFLGMEFKNFKDKQNAHSVDGTNTALSAIQTVFECIIDTIHNFKYNYDVLPAYEQANIRRALADLCGICASLLTVFAVYALSDDDDRKDSTLLNSTLYLADRLYGESRMFLPQGMIPEIKTQWSQPIAGKGVIEDLLSAMGDITQWLMDPDYDPIYRSGTYKGKNKVVVKIKKNIPLVRTIQRIQTINQSNNYYRIGDNGLAQKLVKNFALEITGQKD